MPTFQSTPPVKAATSVARHSAIAASFQSTPPVKAATRANRDAVRRVFISIHAAREGGDYMLTGFIVLLAISIHAAREGGDF